jgi:hypothetical protein
MTLIESDAYQLHNSTYQKRCQRLSKRERPQYHDAPVHATVNRANSTRYSDGIKNPGTTLHMSLNRALAFQDGNNLLPLFAT